MDAPDATPPDPTSPESTSPDSDAPDRVDCSAREGPTGRAGADARLRAALRGLDEDADREDSVAPDPSRVAGHLAGVGDEGLLREAAAHPSVRRLLSDVVSVSGAVEDDARASSGGESLSPGVLARVLAAFDAGVAASASKSAAAGGVAAPGSDGAAGGGLRIVRARRGVRARPWRAAAAVLALLVPVAVVSSLSGRAEAGPVVALEGLDRIGSDGAIATEGPRRLGIGATVIGLPGERLALRMPGGGRLVLPGEDVVRVACDGARCGRALFALDRGVVVLAVSGDGASGMGGAVEPVGLSLPRGDRFDLLAGAARVSREQADRIVVVLRDDAVAIWTPAAGAARDLRGAATLVLEAGAGPVLRTDADPSSLALFRDLEFFGGARREPAPERRIGARRWRIVEDVPSAVTALAGPADVAPRPSVRRSDGSGVPSIRMDLPAGGRARLAWEPDEAALLSRRLVVHLRWAPATSGAPMSASSPASSSSGRVRVELEGVPGAFAEAEPVSEGEPHPLEIEVSLPAGWAAARTEGSDLVLRIASFTQPATVWFECAGFDAAGAPPVVSSPLHPSSPSGPDAPGEGGSGRRGE